MIMPDYKIKYVKNFDLEDTYMKQSDSECTNLKCDMVSS